MKASSARYQIKKLDKMMNRGGYVVVALSYDQKISMVMLKDGMYHLAVEGNESRVQEFDELAASRMSEAFEAPEGMNYVYIPMKEYCKQMIIQLYSKLQQLKLIRD